LKSRSAAVSWLIKVCYLFELEAREALSSETARIAAKAASTTVPIVYYGGADPVSMGLVSSLSRPGGNLTGVTTLNVEMMAKRLEVLHELVPTAKIPFAFLAGQPHNISIQEACRVQRDATAWLGM
jgi:putative tryptophan/tyrosine transport system substrate-binding protein